MSTRPRRLLHHSVLYVDADPTLAAKSAIVIEDRTYTYSQLHDQVLRLATALTARGLQRGDRVAIYMDNTWPCVVSIFATLTAGGVFLVINPQTKADKLAFILQDSGAKILLTDAHLAKEFTSVVPDANHLATVICSGPMNEQAAHESFDRLIAETEPKAVTPGTIPLDLAALIYTSGSTGNPKGVMQTHQSMLFAVGSLVEYLRLSPTDRILLVLPLAFDYGLYQVLMAVHLGATVVMERSFTFPAQVFTRMQEQRVTVFPGVPTIFAMLVSMHERATLVFPEVTRVTNTAAALVDHFALRLRDIFPNALIFKMYGLTECKRVCYLEPELLDQKPGSVGKAIPGTEVYLLSNDGQRAATGETGVLHVRGPHVMAGYWNQPVLTEQMLKPGLLPGERVLCTQDYFRLDAEGFLYFVGRSDDIIKTRGEKVSPAEVENVLHSIGGVCEAAVVGIPDVLLGQAIRAYVVLDPTANLTGRQLRAECAARLENFMIPKEFIFCTALPKTLTGKVSKKALLEHQ